MLPQIATLTTGSQQACLLSAQGNSACLPCPTQGAQTNHVQGWSRPRRCTVSSYGFAFVCRLRTNQSTTLLNVHGPKIISYQALMCNHLQPCYVLTSWQRGTNLSPPSQGHVLLVQVQRPSVTPTTFSQVTYISFHLYMHPSCYAFCTRLHHSRKGQRTGLRTPFNPACYASCTRLRTGRSILPLGAHIPSITWQSQPRQPLQLQAELAT